MAGKLVGRPDQGLPDPTRHVPNDGGHDEPLRVAGLLLLSTDLDVSLPSHVEQDRNLNYTERVSGKPHCERVRRAPGGAAVKKGFADAASPPMAGTTSLFAWLAYYS